ncbi:MAG: Protein translocase subunit SecY [Candidatus Woesebacteria bacterium GW2011_GWB1_43_14]|uniref:Protein translocase subunit SecY n=1 Tax=Candidatus Woesebacteria bacterium GW2011_GWB1_43_14 TaxID=1618578 RepID=A0A0G1DHN9_9BACT|nr:MAG: Protein translocase subunit SecY [Candidatus Woesebacteria bacterium GW2011_GWA1_39_11b]KKS78035.1 MAG: Protein translocase subunit SecY [Candidatus Woesebacteria bacterium GW2011_GWC1_42_9]KKS97385.1 MAG: Protein translocase subunit SecY [Candidatus Woesebacteria bacterium GW2011_GWB1_43_14]
MIAEIFAFFSRSINSPDIRKKIVITGLILAAYRFIGHIPAAGLDRSSLQALFAGSALLSLLDVFSGGTLANFSIMALGLAPYINASIIMQLFTFAIPRFEELSKEGEYGQEKINQYTRFLTIPLSLFQGFGIYVLLNNQNIIPSLTPFGVMALAITMMAGTMLAIWLGELITEYGVGNGISFLIFAGIIARMPVVIGRSAATVQSENVMSIMVFLIVAIVIIGLIVFVNEGTRQIPIRHARARGRVQEGSSASYLPLRVNQAGVIPIIFAVSLVLMPSLVGQFLAGVGNPKVANIAVRITELFNPQSVVYNVFYFFLVFGFTYFYTAIVFNPEKIAENLQKGGSFIPGIRPGSQTVSYLSFVLSRITMIGALFLGLIAILPSLMSGIIGVSNLVIGGTGILIVVSVVLELTRDIEAQLVMRKYEGILR